MCSRGGVRTVPPEEVDAFADLHALMLEVGRQVETWPAGLRRPAPGTDLFWERVVTGRSRTHEVDWHAFEEVQPATSSQVDLGSPILPS